MSTTLIDQREKRRPCPGPVFVDEGDDAPGRNHVGQVADGSDGGHDVGGQLVGGHVGAGPVSLNLGRDDGSEELAQF